MYLLLLSLIYLSFISLGLPDSLLGSGWPAIHESLGVPVSYMGIVSMIISGGTVMSSLLSYRITRKLGTRIVVALSVLMTSLAMFGFAFSHKFYMLIVFAVPYGFGAGAVDAALNNYVAVHYTSKHMSWLHCFWGVGTIVSPFFMSRAVATATWHRGYLYVAVIQLFISAILFLTLPVWKTNPEKIVGEQKSTGLAGVLKIKGVPFIMAGFFAYSSAESTAMYWAGTYFASCVGMSPQQAARYASLIYMGITAGRFSDGFIMNKFGDRKMIVFGACLMFAGLALLMLPVKSVAVAVAGFACLGFGCAPVYPCIIHSTPANFGAQNSGAIIGIQMASAYIGSTFVPSLFGVAGNLFGLEILPAYLLAFTVLMIFMTELTFRTAAKRGGD